MEKANYLDIIKKCLKESEHEKVSCNLEKTMPPEAIYTNDAIYRFLIYYLLEDLPLLETDDRWTLSQAMASWLPYEKHNPEILQRIDDLRAAASSGARKHEKRGC